MLTHTTDGRLHLELTPVSNALSLAEIQSKNELLKKPSGKGFGQPLPGSCKRARSLRSV